MARLPRLVVPHFPHHLVQRSHDGVAIFRDKDDHAYFAGLLREASRQFSIPIHAYALLPDQWRLLVTPAQSVSLSQMMQWIGRQYVPYFNARYQRSGTLWQGRFRGVVIDEALLMRHALFIETVPVRSHLVMRPEDYRWSSYAHHIGQSPDPVINSHASYWALGNTPFERELAYRAMAEEGLSAREADAIDASVLKGWPAGSEDFMQRISENSTRRVTPAQRGRPKKEKTAP